MAEGLWHEFNAIGRAWDFDKFDDFCTRWVQIPLDDLLHLFRADAEVMEVIHLQMGAASKLGVNQYTEGCDNITPSGERGTDKTYTMRRLKRDAIPEMPTP